MSEQPVVHVAIPAINELGFIEKTIECLKNQSWKNFKTYVCVNQPEDYHTTPGKQHIVENNRKTLYYLKNTENPGIEVIDRSSRGAGWANQNHGVGMARKVLMDIIAGKGNSDDIILSLDADTTFGEKYLESVVEQFESNPCATGLANPYYHPLTGNEKIDRAILRYEIYLRYYSLNMRFVGSPYHFTPLGSAMGTSIKMYRKINGITPKKSGEDFYFLQKLTKAGKVIMWNREIVKPGTRLSDRVFFGTGPALIKGIEKGWDAYPLFHQESFETVKKTIEKFPALFTHAASTPMDDFLKDYSGSKDLFEPLRKNSKSEKQFIRACHEKIDGLRILQFLKTEQPKIPITDEQNLIMFLEKHFISRLSDLEYKNISFSTSTIKHLNKIRNFLFETEYAIQKERHKHA